MMYHVWLDKQKYNIIITNLYPRKIMFYFDGLDSICSNPYVT